MNKHQVKGCMEEAKGKVKEVAGRISGNKNMEQKGKIQNTGGKVQAAYGDLKEDIKKAGQGSNRPVRMKHPCTLLVGCCLLAASLPTLAYESRGARSCSVWQEYRQDEKAGAPRNSETYQTWLIGYLSGIVAGSGIDFLIGTDNESAFRMVDAYCGVNLRLNLADAGTSVARDLMRQKGIAHVPTLP